jgi:hypothetical protein
MSFRIFTVIILAFRNNVVKLHLHSLHRSGEINNNNVLKLRHLLNLQGSLLYTCGSDGNNYKVA